MGASRGKILVVDDEPAVAELLCDYLSAQDFDAVAANSGAEALRQLESDKPDAVLLDMRMPEMDGIETLKRIRAQSPRVGVLMISANDDVVLAKQAIALGAFDYTLKPIDFPYLSRALEKMLAAAAPVDREGLLSAPGLTPSPHGTAYDLALAVFRAARTLSPAAHDSVGKALEQAALSFIQLGVAIEKNEAIRTLNRIRSLLRFAKDLGDITDDTHRTLESRVVQARRSVGLP